MAMEPTSITVVVSLPDSRLSGHTGGHWRGKAALTKKYRQEAWLIAMAGKRPSKPWSKATIHYDFFLPTNARQDAANLIHRVKAGLDGCVEAGIITDDCWQVLSIGRVTCQIDRGRPRIELTFTKG